MLPLFHLKLVRKILMKHFCGDGSISAKFWQNLGRVLTETCLVSCQLLCIAEALVDCPEDGNLGLPVALLWSRDSIPFPQRIENVWCSFQTGSKPNFEISKFFANQNDLFSAQLLPYIMLYLKKDKPVWLKQELPDLLPTYISFVFEVSE